MFQASTLAMTWSATEQTAAQTEAECCAGCATNPGCGHYVYIGPNLCFLAIGDYKARLPGLGLGVH